jgi:dephospho-CoA kinase
MKNQASREDRLEIADYVIENNSSLDDLRELVIKTHQKILGIKVDD